MYEVYDCVCFLTFEASCSRSGDSASFGDAFLKSLFNPMKRQLLSWYKNIVSDCFHKKVVLTIWNAVKPSRSSHNVVQVYLFGVDYFVDISRNTHFQALKPVSKWFFRDSAPFDVMKKAVLQINRELHKIQMVSKNWIRLKSHFLHVFRTVLERLRCWPNRKQCQSDSLAYAVNIRVLVYYKNKTRSKWHMLVQLRPGGGQGSVRAQCDG